MFNRLKLKSPSFFLIFFTLCCGDTFAQRLSPFEAVTLNAAAGSGGDRLPYEKTISFFGFISDSSHVDTILDDKPVYYHYLFLPGDVDELGIRLISPVPELFFADRGDIESEEFISKNQSDKSKWFDAAIRLEKIDINTTDPSESGKIIAINYKSKDVPGLPNSKSDNPLIRIINDSVTEGFYRIAVINEISEQTRPGSYVIHIGTVPGMRGIRI
jgi:hypothetical protein